MSKRSCPSDTSRTQSVHSKFKNEAGTSRESDQRLELSSHSSSSEQLSDTSTSSSPQRKNTPCEFIHISSASLCDSVEKSVNPPTNGSYSWIVLDMEHFEAHEIEAKVLGDNIFIVAEQFEKRDVYGCVSRQFELKLSLPPNIDSQQLFCKLYTDGFLTIIGPLKQPQDEVGRTVQIQHTEEPLIFKQKDFEMLSDRE